MDRGALDTVAKLIAKAQSTDSDDEASALLTRAYSLIARTLNDYWLALDGPQDGRKRERRLLVDRRAPRQRATSAETASPPAGAADAYVRFGDRKASQRQIDFPL